MITSLNTDKDVLDTLERKYGKIDIKSEVISFDFTTYYFSEMGCPLKRYWFSFSDLIFPEQLADIKLETNQIERDFSVDGKRRVNIDPGYLALSKLVLASTKDFSHRVYIKDGIYAEVTMRYIKKEFQFLPWTYPDYRTETFIRFISEVRNRLLLSLKVSHT